MDRKGPSASPYLERWIVIGKFLTTLGLLFVPESRGGHG